MKQLSKILAILIFFWLISLNGKNNNTLAQVADKPVILTVDLTKEIGPMYPAWAWFGYDEPNYTYMKDGKKVLSEISDLSPVPVFVRVHNNLTREYPY